MGKHVPTNNAIVILWPVFFLSFIGVYTLITPMPVAVFVYFCGLSIVLFIMYGLDKAAAKNGNWRISESTLIFFALAGGWPGALFAQQYFRHKTRKKTFLRVFWFTVFLNCMGLMWLATPQGIEILGLIVKQVELAYLSYL